MAVDTEELTVGQVGKFGRIWNGEKWVQPPKTSKAVGKPKATPVEGEVLRTSDDYLSELAEFASLLGQAGQKKMERREVLDKLGDLLGKLDPSEYQSVLEHPVTGKLIEQVVEAKVSSGSNAPGSDLGAAIGKIPWTWRDIVHMPRVVFTPMESVPVSYNGLTWFMVAELTQEIPSCFVDVYIESRRLRRQAVETVEYLTHKRNHLTDPGAIPMTLKTRGLFTGGEMRTSGGLQLQVPDGDRPGMDSVGEGEGEE